MIEITKLTLVVVVISLFVISVLVWAVVLVLSG